MNASSIAPVPVEDEVFVGAGAEHVRRLAAGRAARVREEVVILLAHVNERYGSRRTHVGRRLLMRRENATTSSPEAGVN